MTPDVDRTEDQKALAALSDGYIEELEKADVLVIGLPMYNFGIPSVLKAWIDRVARAGRRFVTLKTAHKDYYKVKRLTW